MTNREKVRTIASMCSSVEVLTDCIEIALDDERKAGELDGQIKALEWCRDMLGCEFEHLENELYRLRAEKEKLR